jgi:hypothetical protein
MENNGLKTFLVPTLIFSNEVGKRRTTIKVSAHNAYGATLMIYGVYGAADVAIDHDNITEYIDLDAFFEQRERETKKGESI